MAKIKQKETVQGRSFIFNVLFVVVNLVGLTLITIGGHENFKESSTIFTTVGWALILLSAAGILLFRGRLMMSSVARVIVGGLFIVSGLVKANDPLGFSYKLEEYFEDGALAFRIKELFGAPSFSLEFLIEWALFLSIVICIAEIVLGVLVIIGGKIKTVSYLLLGMMLFFTFLTWHTANCDSSMKFVDRDTYEVSDPLAVAKMELATSSEEITIVSKTSTEVVIDELKLPQCVDDCGCFGDALKGSVGRSLTPRESLWKDIVLLYLVVWIFIAQWIIEPNTRKQNIVFGLSSLIVIVFFSFVFGWYFPILFGGLSIVGALWIRKIGGPILGNHIGSALIVTLFTGIFVIIVMMYRPMKDYRPYAVGSNLIENMNNSEAAIYEHYYFVTNNETGKKERVEMSDIDPSVWSDSKKWTAEFDTSICLKPIKLASITEQFGPFLNIGRLTDAELSLDFVKQTLDSNQVEVVRVKNLSSNDIYNVPMEEFILEDYPLEHYSVIDTTVQLSEEMSEMKITNLITQAEKIVLISAKNIESADWDNIDRVKNIYKKCQELGIPFVMITNGTEDQIKAFRSKYSFNPPIFINDETELKAIGRSNPTLLVIENAVVTAKYSHRSIPTAQKLIENVLNK